MLPNSQLHTTDCSSPGFNLYDKETQKQPCEWGIVGRNKGHLGWEMSENKLLQTTSLEALGIFICPWKYWFVSLLLFPSMLQTKTPIPSRHLAVPPLWHWAASVLCGFMKVAHQSHDVIRSLLTTISSGLSSTFNSTDPSLQKGFSIKVSLKQEAVFQLRAAGFLQNVSHL